MEGSVDTSRVNATEGVALGSNDSSVLGSIDCMVLALGLAELIGATDSTILGTLECPCVGSLEGFRLGLVDGSVETRR
jgi:hypothetical protein